MRTKLVFALVLGLGTGVSVGVIFAKRTIGMTYGVMSQWAAVGTYAQLANFEYQYGDDAHARAALSDFLTFAQGLHATSHVADPKTLEASVARAYLRLAVLDRRAGYSDSYRMHLSQAQEARKAAGAVNNSVEDLERFVNKLDAQR